MTIKTRFAPSPTGYLHVGGARTALFSWLFARRHGGQFVLRIEDTDLERSTQESVDAILEAMDWLGLDHDEGPFYQTQRFDRYNAVIEQMLASGQAYHCYCIASVSTACVRSRWRPSRSRATTGAAAQREVDPAEPHVVRFPQSAGRRGRHRRPGPRRDRAQQRRTGRPDHPPRRRHADLQPVRRRRRPGHGHHPRDPRRRPRQQHAAPDQHPARARRTVPPFAHCR